MVKNSFESFDSYLCLVKNKFNKTKNCTHRSCSVFIVRFVRSAISSNERKFNAMHFAIVDLFIYIWRSMTALEHEHKILI